MPPTPRASLSRRGVLAAGAAAGLVSGCSSSDAGTAPGTPPSDAPDVSSAADALADEQRIVALIDAVTSRHPKLEKKLQPARRVHDRHVELLLAAAPTPTTTAPATVVVPRRPVAALALVVRAEDTLRRAQCRRCDAAVSGPYARLLAAMAAAAAQQSTVLRSAG